MNKYKLNQYSGKYRVRLKNFMFLAVFILLACGWDQGCGTGPEHYSSFQITFSRGDNGKTQFYFTPPEKLILSKIISRSTAINFTNTIEFKYPFLICDKSKRHIINEFKDVQIGQIWEFQFYGPDNGGEIISSVSITIN